MDAQGLQMQRVWVWALKPATGMTQCQGVGMEQGRGERHTKLPTYRGYKSLHNQPIPGSGCIQ